MTKSDREKVEIARIETDDMLLRFIRTELETGATFLNLAETELTWEGVEAAQPLLAKVGEACREATAQITRAKLRNQDTAELESGLQDLERKTEELWDRVEKAKKTSS